MKRLPGARPAAQNPVIECRHLDRKRRDEIVIERGVVVLDDVHGIRCRVCRDSVDGAIVGIGDIKLPRFILAERRDRESGRELLARRPHALRIARSAPHRSAAQIAVQKATEQCGDLRSAINAAADDRAPERMRIFDYGIRERGRSAGRAAAQRRTA